MTIKHIYVKLNKYGRPIRWSVLFYGAKRYKIFVPSNGRKTIWADELPSEIKHDIFSMKCSYSHDEEGGCKVYIYEHKDETA